MPALPGRGTLVSVHAHPDDEALWTGGTLAAAAAAGRRTVLVVATDGAAGLAAPETAGGHRHGGRAGGLGARRLAELERSAAVLGVQRLVLLGHPDSGSARPAPGGFATLPVAPEARRLAELLVEEEAATVTSYDAAGGYGHPDHVQVHRVAAAAVSRAQARLGHPVQLLEATVERERVLPLAQGLRVASRVLPVPRVPDLHGRFTARADIAYRVDVRQHLPTKLDAIAAHASQRTGGPRTASLLLGLPRPLQRLVLGTEWFAVATTRPPG